MFAVQPQQGSSEQAPVLSLSQNRSVGRNRCLCCQLGAGFKPLASNDHAETYRVRPQLWFCPLSWLGAREKGRAGLLEAPEAAPR